MPVPEMTLSTEERLLKLYHPTMLQSEEERMTKYEKIVTEDGFSWTECSSFLPQNRNPNTVKPTERLGRAANRSDLYCLASVLGVVNGYLPLLFWGVHAFSGVSEIVYSEFQYGVVSETIS